MDSIYPVGSVYIGTQSTCPLASLIEGSTWTLVSSGKALWTGNGSNANTTISAGLPNISGEMSRVGNTAGTVLEDNGCFTVSEPFRGIYAGGNGRTTGEEATITFMASSSNSIYGKSTTVQPPAYVVNVWRRTA